MNFLDTNIFTERKRERERQTDRHSHRSPVVRGGRVVRWCWVNFHIFTNIFTERKRDRQTDRHSHRSPVVRGWSGGAG